MALILTGMLISALAALAYQFDLSESLGAHPWWSQQTLLIGVPLGLAAALILRSVIPSRAIVWGAAIASLAAMIVAKYGRTQFAASYAEDVLAGRLWYFGWIAVPAALALLLSLLTHHLLGTYIFKSRHTDR
ncbi:hypothetical protein NBRC116601_29360 [Cognatishimia sp. WU-CL00825]|uniref:hypothetical protein n=1 Tax=Cognatishimia sp. WU-CL00825 TaxID=3127658 RepID=UPI00310875BB